MKDIRKLELKEPPGLDVGDELTAGALAVTKIIGDRYQILELIGKGGMGSVYLVEQIYLRKQFALKTLNPGNSEVLWRRFQKEAQAASGLDHPCLLKVHDFGTIDDRQPFFVMDFFDGETLSNRLKKTGPLKLDETLDLFIRVCHALAYAHQQGVVHRDIKPSNIMVSNSDPTDLRIVDFGIAKFTNGDDSEVMALTRAGEVFGTPYYMSPEQSVGSSADHRSDIYSLGCVMYEMLAGAPPFFGQNALSTMMQHQSEKVPSLKEASLGNHFPAALDKLVARLLEKRPEDRYQDLLEVAADLERIQKGEDVRLNPRQALATTSTGQRITKQALILFAVIGCLLMAFLAGQVTAPNTVSTTKKVSGAEDLYAIPVIQNSSSSASALALSKASEGFYSTSADAHTRLFRFTNGTLDGPGALLVDPDVNIFSSRAIVGKRVDAVGDLTMDPFKPFGLYVNPFNGKESECLLRFRPDELKFISFKNAILSEPTPDAFKNVSLLRSIEAIDMSETSGISDNDLEYLNCLPNLKRIEAGHSDLTGTRLLRLKNLPLLTSLSVEAIKKSEVVLPQLAKTGVIEELNLRLSNLSLREFDLIAKLHRLKKLELSGMAFGDDCFAKLTTLKKLETLNISGSAITPLSIQYFRQMPLLKQLVFDCKGWSQIDQDLLHKALPSTCEVIQP